MSKAQEIVEGRRQRGEMIVKSYYGHTEGSIYDILLDLFTYGARSRKTTDPSAVATLAARTAVRDIIAAAE